MNQNFFRLLAMACIVLIVSGCATTRPRPAQTQDANAQVSVLQNQLQAKDQEIQDLHSQLDSRQQALSNNFAAGGSDKHHLLHVSGVAPIDLQRALLRAGFDPGPVDGRLGKKTRSAVKAFQKKHHLTADGVVGDKTWAALQSS